jgi:hypothetical protein
MSGCRRAAADFSFFIGTHVFTSVMIIIMSGTIYPKSGRA